MPFVHIPAMLMKDAAARLIMGANKYVNRRELVPVMRHQNIRVYRGVVPLHSDALFIAPSAMVQGNVMLGHGVCIFYHTNIRNYNTDKPTIVGDNVVLAENTTLMGQVKIGAGCFIGVNCSFDCCEVMNNAYIAHGCCVQLGCVIEDGAVLALGTNLPKDTRVKANEYWAGNPGKFVCNVDEAIRDKVQGIAHEYLELGQKHRHAIDEHLNDSVTLDEDWLKRTVAKMEARRSDVAVPVTREIPSIAKRFIQPRVTARLPQFHVRISYPQCRQAPWMVIPADNNGNA